MAAGSTCADGRDRKYRSGPTGSRYFGGNCAYWWIWMSYRGLGSLEKGSSSKTILSLVLEHIIEMRTDYHQILVSLLDGRVIIF